MNLLDSLALRYGSDKCPRIKHSYTEFYYELFKDRRKSVKKVVEIGIGSPENMNHYPGYKMGASLYMWRDFFPNAQIYGADILPELMFEDRRIKTFVCDQTISMELVLLIKQTGSDIDLFIDDGCHDPMVQLFTCLTVVPLLDKKSVYVTEDVGRIGIIEELRHFNAQKITFPGKASRDDRLIMIRRDNG